MKGEEYTPERYEPDQYKASPIAYEHWHRYLSITSLVQDKSVLDVACGNGYGSNLLSSYASEVLGVDIDKAVIDSCKKNYIKNCLSFDVGTVSSLPVDSGSVDVVVSFETIEHVSESDQDRFMLEVNRVLRPDGVLIISTPNLSSPRYSGVDNMFHLKEYDKKEFIIFCKKYFQNVSIFGQSVITGSVIKRDDVKRDGLDLLEIRYDESGTPSIVEKSVSDKFVIAVCSDNVKSGLCESVLWDVDNSYMSESEKYIGSLERALVGQREAAEKHIEALNKWATSSEAYANSLSDELGKLSDLYELEKKARREENSGAIQEMSNLREWATSSEAYAKSLGEELKKYR